jgi:hypothetical protein
MRTGYYNRRCARLIRARDDFSMDMRGGGPVLDASGVFFRARVSRNLIFGFASLGFRRGLGLKARAHFEFAANHSASESTAFQEEPARMRGELVGFTEEKDA